MIERRGTIPAVLLPCVLAVLALGLALPSRVAAAAEEAKPAAANPGRGPLPLKVAAVSSHAPFEAGECQLCHERADPKDPGAVPKKGKDLCLGCHEEFNATLAQPHVHPPVKRGCVSCHNAHNSAQRKLLADAPGTLCAKCHEDVVKVATDALVPHRAVTTGAQCLACHTPHAGAIDALLVRLPFDLCVGCHNRDDMKDAAGKPLQNTQAWLAANKSWHGPVAKKDCSACHQPHGSDHFRLVKQDYPREFYATYDPRTYELCFGCHEEPAFSTPRTTALTSFRDGDRNLHYVHLQQGGRGRTCRACHEVHASSQDHHIREGVPYGSSGWVLKLNYVTTPTGGSCAKTCHQEKAYDNRRKP